MKMSRSALLVAVPAQASAAWVLWSFVQGDKEPDGHWSRISASETKAECLEEARPFVETLHRRNWKHMLDYAAKRGRV